MAKSKTTDNKKAKKAKEKEIFDFKEEIVIGINNNNSKNTKKGKNVKNNKTSTNNNGNKKKSNAKKQETKKNVANNKEKQQGKAQKKKPTSNISPDSMPKKETQNKKSKKISIAILKWFTLIILLIGAIIALMLSPIFNIEDVEVTNNNKVTTGEVISLSNITKGENLFKVLALNIRENIKQNAYIENVKIKLNLPNKIILNVEERTPQYIIAVGGAYAYIDNQGYILEILTEPTTLTIISNYKTDISEIKAGNRLNLEDLNSMQKIIEIMTSATSHNVNTEIKEIIITEEGFTMNLNDGKVAYIKDTTELNTKMIYLKGIIEKAKDREGEVFLDGIYNKKSIFFREKV